MARDQNVTLQADGWTGTNSHHFLALMMTFNKQVKLISLPQYPSNNPKLVQAYTINVHNASSEQKTAENLMVHLENAMRTAK